MSEGAHSSAQRRSNDYNEPRKSWYVALTCSNTCQVVVEEKQVEWNDWMMCVVSCNVSPVAQPSQIHDPQKREIKQSKSQPGNDLETVTFTSDLHLEV